MRSINSIFLYYDNIFGRGSRMLFNLKESRIAMYNRGWYSHKPDLTMKN